MKWPVEVSPLLCSVSCWTSVFYNETSSHPWRQDEIVHRVHVSVCT